MLFFSSKRLIVVLPYEATSPTNARHPRIKRPTFNFRLQIPPCQGGISCLKSNPRLQANPERKSLLLGRPFGRRHHERHLLLRRPASKKRQRTKSREVGWRLGGERYGELMRAPSALVGARLGRRDLRAWMQGWRERGKGVSAGAWSVSTGAECIDRRESSREGSSPWWRQRKGTGKRRRSEEVWLMTCRACPASAATSARSRM